MVVWCGVWWFFGGVVVSFGDVVVIVVCRVVPSVSVEEVVRSRTRLCRGGGACPHQCAGLSLDCECEGQMEGEGGRLGGVGEKVDVMRF